MRGTSAQSQRQVVAAVEEAVGDSDAGVLGDELFAVVDVLDSAPSLRRILTDPAAAEDAKVGLARSLFADKVSEATMVVLAATAKQRWSSSRDIGDALETAGVIAHVLGAERAGQLDEVEDEMFRFGRVAHGNGELRAALADRALPRTRKRDLVRSLLQGRSTEHTVSLVSEAVVARQGSFEVTLARYGELAAERRSQLVALVRSAYDLDLDERERLAAALERTYGKPVHLNVVVDPSVLGGLAVQVGDEVIDATVSGRLHDAHRRLTG
ncbi:F0F1 ATP synthase subunit delta [soil metagenome]